AVLVVHHQIARGQRQRVDDVASLGGQSLAVDRGRPFAVQIGLVDHDEVGPGNHDTVVQRPLEHADDAYLRGGAAFQKGCGSVGFSKLLYDAVRGAGARGDDGCVATGRNVGAQHREDLVDAGLLTTRRRRGPDVELDRRLVGKL